MKSFRASGIVLQANMLSYMTWVSSCNTSGGSSSSESTRWSWTTRTSTCACWVTDPVNEWFLGYVVHYDKPDHDKDEQKTIRNKLKGRKELFCWIKFEVNVETKDIANSCKEDCRCTISKVQVIHSLGTTFESCSSVLLRHAQIISTSKQAFYC
jgi:hypothetical protein